MAIEQQKLRILIIPCLIWFCTGFAQEDESAEAPDIITTPMWILTANL